jgi:rare lipoprotein A
MKHLCNVIFSASVLFLSFALASPISAASQTGIASIYANGDGHAGSKTANGERVNPNALTAAHKSLPFGTRVTVTNTRNGRSVTVRINDRGPFVRGRVIDLTPAGARAIAFSGLAPVSLTVVGHGG